MKDENKTSKLMLSVKDLVVEYTSGKDIIQAVNGVSFTINYGQTLGLVGETGAGKTTIAKSILRLLPVPPARVKSGVIELDGKDLMQFSDKEIRKIRGNRISMIFQDPMTALNPVLRIGDQIAEVIQTHEHVSKREGKQKAMDVLEMVGISSDRYNDYPRQFSGGMKQRVIIAIALACSPDLLIADEPTTALDVTIQAQVLDMITELQKRQNSAMILITHDFGIVAKSCDSVAVVYGGNIVEYGSKEQLFRNPKHPYTQGLFGAIPKLNTDVNRLNVIRGLPPDPAHLPKGCCFAPRCVYATAECRKAHVEQYDVGDGHLCSCLRYANTKANTNE